MTRFKLSELGGRVQSHGSFVSDEIQAVRARRHAGYVVTITVVTFQGQDTMLEGIASFSGLPRFLLSLIVEFICLFVCSTERRLTAGK